jgi:tetratricopeptide (TPR) repeat protein
MKIQISIYGENHQDVADSFFNLGLVYNAKGLFDLAIQYHESAMKIRISIYGENHPSVAISFNDLGIAYLAKG